MKRILEKLLMIIFMVLMNNNITEKGAYRANSAFTFLTAVK